MKQWEKPEMLDLDAKFTENTRITTSGGCPEPPTCDKWQSFWDEYGYLWDNDYDKFLEYIQNKG